jgi:hypothetical protein
VAEAAATLAQRNRRTLFGAMGFVAFMVGVSFAAVPLYDLFCRATGYGGTPMLGSAAPGAAEGPALTIRFVAATHPDLPWSFRPAAPAGTCRPVLQPFKSLHAIDEVVERLAEGGMLWVSWPKKTCSSPPGQLSEDDLRAVALPLGLVDVKVCAVDATWSGLKLVRRRAPAGGAAR